MLFRSERLRTWYFETKSDARLDAPPSLDPGCGVELGDLFLHWYDDDNVQVWLRTLPEDDDEEEWEEISVGYIRDDGRQFIITPTNKYPSWVGGDWGSRRVAASE